jgi:hypothetical protein
VRETITCLGSSELEKYFRPPRPPFPWGEGHSDWSLGEFFVTVMLWVKKRCKTTRQNAQDLEYFNIDIMS